MVAVAFPFMPVLDVQAPGEVLLRGLNADGSPLIVERNDQNFIDGLLNDLRQGVDVARRSRARDRQTLSTRDGQSYDTLKLYQPVSRSFHLALFELVCNDGYAYPRLDPRKLISAGLVIRRVVPGQLLAWGKDNRGAQGWLNVSAAQLDADPDPGKRVPVVHTGIDTLDQQIALLNGGPVVEEAYSPLFPVPPDVMEATGRTIVYGVLPLASSDMTVAPNPFSNPNDLRNHLPSYLRAVSGQQEVGRANTYVTFDTIQAALDNQNNRDNGLFLDYVNMLRQLVYEFGVFDANPSSPALNMLNVLAGINLWFRGSSTNYYSVPASMALRSAADVLIFKRGGSVLMPLYWLPITESQATAIQNAASQIINARIAQVRPQEGRYSNPRWRYSLRAFARVQHDPDCPPTLEWSSYSELFSIAPWYEGKNPPLPIVLPGLDAVSKGAKVAFSVPRDLQGVIESNDPKNMIDGKGKSMSLTIDWLCSISLPVITICAYIVLNIFLSLFFLFLFAIKLCIPIPRPQVE